MGREPRTCAKSDHHPSIFIAVFEGAEWLDKLQWRHERQRLMTTGNEIMSIGGNCSDNLGSQRLLLRGVLGRGLAITPEK